MLPLTKQITDATTSGSSDTTRKKRFDERMEKLMIQAYTTPETSAAAAISTTAAGETDVLYTDSNMNYPPCQSCQPARFSTSRR